MSRREEWRKVLDAEVGRWSAMPHDELVSALHEHQAYESENEAQKHQVQVKVLEITEKYLHVVVAVNDGTPARPLSRSFFCRTN